MILLLLLLVPATLAATLCHETVSNLRANDLQCTRRVPCTADTVAVDCRLPTQTPATYYALCLDGACAFNYTTAPTPFLLAGNDTNSTQSDAFSVAQCFGAADALRSYCFIGLCVVDVGCVEYPGQPPQFQYECDCVPRRYLRCVADADCVSLDADVTRAACQSSVCDRSVPTFDGAGVCTTSRAPPPVPDGCCVSDSDCNDRNPCTTERCAQSGTSTSRCEYTPVLNITGCCATSSHCRGAPASVPQCPPAVCAAGQCLTTPTSPVCNTTERCIGGTHSYCAAPTVPLPLTTSFSCDVTALGQRCRIVTANNQCLYGVCTFNATNGVLCAPTTPLNETFACNCACGAVITESQICGPVGTEVANQCVPPDAVPPTCDTDGDSFANSVGLGFLIAMIVAMAVVMTLFTVFFLVPCCRQRTRTGRGGGPTPPAFTDASSTRPRGLLGRGPFN